VPVGPEGGDVPQKAPDKGPEVRWTAGLLRDLAQLSSEFIKPSEGGRLEGFPNPLVNGLPDQRSAEACGNPSARAFGRGDESAAVNQPAARRVLAPRKPSETSPHPRDEGSGIVAIAWRQPSTSAGETWDRGVGVGFCNRFEGEHRTSMRCRKRIQRPRLSTRSPVSGG
jgi:hypothetical protein